MYAEHFTPAKNCGQEQLLKSLSEDLGGREYHSMKFVQDSGLLLVFGGVVVLSLLAHFKQRISTVAERVRRVSKQITIGAGFHKVEKKADLGERSTEMTKV